MHGVVGGAWASVGAGCRISCAVVDGSVHLALGAAPHEHELTFEPAALREVVVKSMAALAQLDSAVTQDTVG